MNKNFKTGMLAILLALPVFVLLFLYKFGNNKFKIPIYHAEDSTLVNGQYEITKAHTIPDFKMITNEGKYLSNKDLSNSVYVVDFFYTKCPGMCKVLSSDLVRVQEAYKKNPRVKLLSFTVDPENDSPEILNRYAKEHRAIPGKWFFLTASKDSIYDLGQHGFFVMASDDTTGSGEFNHARHLVLVDKEGRIRGYYDGLEKEQVDRLITEIEILLKNYDDK